MERVFGLKRIARHPRAVATLGVFDGVHRGHQAVLAETVAWARRINGTAVAITFDRHPDTVVRATPPATITSLEHRLLLIEKLAVDVVVVLHFDESLRGMEPEDFAREVFVERLGAAGVVLGFSSRFGKGARGNSALLAKVGKRCGFEVRATEPCLVAGLVVSSTLIRSLITRGELTQASELLGRPVSILGTVMHGDKRGKALGFPTANLNLHHEVTPPAGVYISRVLFDGRALWGLVNIGYRPTFLGQGEPPKKTIEVYIDEYDAGEGLYARAIEAQIVRFLRSERRFESAEALTLQMEKDRRMLRTFKTSWDQRQLTP